MALIRHLFDVICLILGGGTLVFPALGSHVDTGPSTIKWGGKSDPNASYSSLVAYQAASSMYFVIIRRVIIYIDILGSFP
jgi:hypothetical protein